MEHRYCATCATETLVDRPECLDGHEADCPDACCVECGAAFYVGLLVVEERVLVRRHHRAA